MATKWYLAKQFRLAIVVKYIFMITSIIQTPVYSLSIIPTPNITFTLYQLIQIYIRIIYNPLFSIGHIFEHIYRKWLCLQKSFSKFPSVIPVGHSSRLSEEASRVDLNKWANYVVFFGTVYPKNESTSWHNMGQVVPLDIYSPIEKALENFGLMVFVLQKLVKLCSWGFFF